MAMTFDEAIRSVKQKVAEAIEECCIIVEADAKQLCPIDTGTLKRSITHDVRQESNKVKGTVGTNVEYAYWAEKNQPYLEPAADQNKATIERKIQQVLNEVGSR